MRLAKNNLLLSFFESASNCVIIYSLTDQGVLLFYFLFFFIRLKPCGNYYVAFTIALISTVQTKTLFKRTKTDVKY